MPPEGVEFNHGLKSGRANEGMVQAFYFDD